MAQTYNEDEVVKAWPKLCGLAWPQRRGWTGRSALPEDLARRTYGVADLVRDLADAAAFADWPGGLKKLLGPGIEEAENLHKELEAALADWDPRKANRLSDELEDRLDQLERSTPAD